MSFVSVSAARMTRCDVLVLDERVAASKKQGAGSAGRTEQQPPPGQVSCGLDRCAACEHAAHGAAPVLSIA